MLEVPQAFRCVVGTASLVYPLKDISEEDKVTLEPIESTFDTEKGSTTRQLISLVGDKDDFRPNDAADVPPQSDSVERILEFSETPPVNLDIGGTDRMVGFTHYFTVPGGAQITSAKIRFQFQGEVGVENDVILYDQSSFVANPTQGYPGFVPFIALRDLLGREPHADEIHELEIDLQNTPIRTVNSSPPGGSFTP